MRTALRGSLLALVAVLLPACEEDGTDSVVTSGPGPGDLSAPAAILLHVVAVGSTSVTLEWTAPGDDVLTGTASAYELRTAPAPVTDATWATAAVVMGLPGPAAPGTRQVHTVSGLSAATVHHFAMRALDDGLNASALSNSVRARTGFTTELLFTSDTLVAGTIELWAADFGGTTLVKLAGALPPGGDVLAARISPDGLRVAIRGELETLGRPELFVVPAEGGPRVKVSGAPPASGNPVLDFAWSPSGNRLAFRRAFTGFRPELFTVKPDGSELVRVCGDQDGVNGVAATTGPPYAWAPDGSRVAYTSDEDVFNRLELFTVVPDGSGRVRVSGAISTGIREFTWSPLSSRIAYSVMTSPHELRTTLPDSPAGDAVVSAVLYTGGTTRFAWAPDGSRIGYLAVSGSVARLWTVLPAGGGGVEVNGAMVASGGILNWAWAPDSSRLAYSADQDVLFRTELYTSLPAGGGNVKVSGPIGPSEFVGEFAWAPNASRLAYRSKQGGSDDIDLYSTLPTTSAGNLRISERNWTAGGDVSEFGWSPDSSRLAYVGQLNIATQAELFTSDPAIGGNTRVSAPLVPGGGVGWFRWSPGSSRLAYLADQEKDGRYEFYSSDASSVVGNAKLSGPTQNNTLFPAFQP